MDIEKVMENVRKMLPPRPAVKFTVVNEKPGLFDRLNSVEDRKKGIYIMWGDSGTGTFMIPLENLRKLDFSRVTYNYDCY